MDEQTEQELIEEVGEVVEKIAWMLGWTVEKLLVAIKHRHKLIHHSNKG